MGPPHLIQYVSAAHTRICYSSVSPLQEACAIGKWIPSPNHHRHYLLHNSLIVKKNIK